MNRPAEITPTTVTAAKRAGRRAAHAGVLYTHGRELFASSEAKLLLAWSQGHNAARLQMIRRK